MLKTRVKTAAVLTAIILPLLIFSHVPYLLSTFAALLSVSGVYELYHGANLLHKKGFLALSMILAALIPMVEIPFYLSLILPTVFPLILLCFLIAMLRIDEMPVPGLITTFFLSLTVPLFFASIPLLRTVPYGLLYLLLFVLVCVTTDAAAYFVGRSKGRNKLAPSVSPSKTIEGALGGAVTTVIVSMLFCILVELFTGTPVHYPAVMLYAAVTSVIAQIGDLSMSLFKRRVGIKDFGKILPGHGGILDRFDSQLFAAPFTLIFVESICPLFVK